MGIEVVDSTAKAQTVARTSASKEYVATETNSSNEAPTIEGMNKPISKANAVAYNYITQSQAQMLAESLDYSGLTSSLMFGVQWDMVCVFIEHYDTNNTATTKSQWITSNTYGQLWGNYNNSTFTMYRGYYSTTYSSNPVRWNNANEKNSSERWLCTTGSSEQNSSLNIYDFGGNLWEWTLERYSISGYPCVNRGGYFFYNQYASYRSSDGNTCTADFNDSARLTLFI